MKNNLFVDVYPRTEWVRRFAYRAMLCRNELDTASATVLADIQFDGMQGSDPEAAAEYFVGPAPVLRHASTAGTGAHGSSVSNRLASVLATA
jgi:hypothetical protein